MKQRYLAILFLLFCWMAASAQFPLVRNFGARDYSGATQNWMVRQSADGCVFVANNLGLMKFNGVSWQMAYVSNYTYVHALDFGPDGRIYVGAFDDFGYFVDSEPFSRARYVSLSAALPESERGFHDIWKVISLSDGNILFQSAQALYIYSPSARRLRVIRVSDRINDLSVAGNRVFVSTSACVYELRSGTLVALQGSEAMARRGVCGVSLMGQNPLFLSRHNGFFILDGDNFIPYSVPLLSDALVDKTAFCFAMSQRWIAVGTVAHGLLAFDRANNRLQRLCRENVLANNTVLSIFIDADSNFWTAFDNGLAYIMNDSPFHTLFTGTTSIGTGYASMPFGGRFYVGSNQGLYHTAMPGDYSSLRFEPERVAGIEGQVWTLASLGGSLLCGSHDGAFEVVGSQARRIDGIGSAWGFREIPGSDGHVLVSLYDGFAVMKRREGRWQVVARPQWQWGGTVNFEIDADGSVWYSHWLRGVYRFTLSDDYSKVTLVDFYNSANGLPTDENNLVALVNGRVVISAVNGFYRRDLSTGRLAKVEWLDRLFPANGIAATRIIPAPDGSLWGYLPDRLTLAERRDGRYTALPFHNAMAVRSLHLNLGNVSFLPGSNAAVMGCDDGYFIVDPALTRPVSRSVRVDYAGTLPSDTAESHHFYCPLPESPDNPQPVMRIKRSHNSLVFSFSRPEYRDPHAVEFSTRVVGYDDRWTPYSTQATRELTRIPPGTYTFEVRSRDLVTGHASATAVRFRVEAAWYETIWARILFVVVLVAALYFIVEALKRSINSRRERRIMAEEQHRARLRENDRLSRENASMARDAQRLNLEIKKKSSELADTDMMMQRNSDFLQQVNDGLDDLASAPDLGPEARRKLQALIRSTRIHSHDEASWTRLEENFNIIFDDLLTTLADRYPSLTRNDIRLCSYLRLGMSTKQIASTMNISERSVDSNRYRLRKKLGMPTSQTFTDFFSKIV